ncbi:MAG: hypothetical protein R2864_11485 [Syntrophotaleaceae bacterium]
MVNSNYLAFFNLEGKLNVIPTHSILRVEIEPAPNVLINNTIKDIRPIS